MDVFLVILLAILAIIVLSLVLGSFFTVNTAQVAVITRFGKFLRVADPGLNWKVPYFDTVAGMVSLRVNQITLTMETKTKDNVFVTIPISVQNRVLSLIHIYHPGSRPRRRSGYSGAGARPAYRPLLHPCPRKCAALPAPELRRSGVASLSRAFSA